MEIPFIPSLGRACGLEGIHVYAQNVYVCMHRCMYVCHIYIYIYFINLCRSKRVVYIRSLTLCIAFMLLTQKKARRASNNVAEDHRGGDYFDQSEWL